MNKLSKSAKPTKANHKYKQGSQQPFETKLVHYVLIASLPPTCILLYTLWFYGVSVYLTCLIAIITFSIIGFCAYNLKRQTSYQLRSLANLLTGLTEGDFSMRGIRHHGEGALSELVRQINNLTDTLEEQRFIAHESQLLVSKVIQHIDVAIIAIDQKKNIALLNPSAEKLLNTSQALALGKPLNDFQADELLSIENEKVLSLSFARELGNLKVIHDHYREQGKQHDLFFITNIHGLLRENEQQAWQNLIRVISHEINNSLSPIASLANTLKSQAQKQQLNEVYADNLQIIAERAKGLKGFIDSYRQLSTLPKPNKVNTNIVVLIDKVKPLFPHIHFSVIHDEVSDVLASSALGDSDLCDPVICDPVLCDPVLIEQVLINIIKNADEACQGAVADTQTTIAIKLTKVNKQVVVTLTDNGGGIFQSENLFTPFYSTKNKGSGIGLIFSRQVVEAHGGYLTISNREDESGVKGCIVELAIHAG